MRRTPLAGARATERGVRMRTAQGGKLPGPYLDVAAPASMMQLRHRESVVQFINEVVQFINEVCEDFSLQTQTAGLAISYFDRFVSRTRGVDKERVHLLAITCTLLAAKFSELKMPGLDDLCVVVGQKHTKAQLKAMEMEVLAVLRWELHAVTPRAALEQLAILVHHTGPHAKPFLEHAEFFIDMSYYEYKVIAIAPLVIAASALLCAWLHLGNVQAAQLHAPQLSALCGVCEGELSRCRAVLQDYFAKTFPQAAEEAEIFRAAGREGRDSHDSVMTQDHQGAAPEQAKAEWAPSTRMVGVVGSTEQISALPVC